MTGVRGRPSRQKTGGYEKNKLCGSPTEPDCIIRYYRGRQRSVPSARMSNPGSVGTDSASVPKWCFPALKSAGWVTKGQARLQSMPLSTEAACFFGLRQVPRTWRTSRAECRTPAKCAGGLYEPVTSRSLRPSVERGAVRRPRLTCVTPNALSINGKLSPVNNEAPASGGVRCMFQLAAMSTFGVGGCTSVPAFPEFPYMEPAPV